MSRNRASAKKAGASFESLVADYLAARVDDRVERRTKHGRNDRGDVSGLRHMGGRIVVECKNYGGRLEVGTWLNEAEVERGNDAAVTGLVVAKRHGKGAPGEQIVLMTLDNLIGLLTGTNPTDQPESGDA